MTGSGFRFCALGGLGEVGMNSCLFDFGDRQMLVDLGISLPDSLSSNGVNVAIPDLSYLHTLRNPDMSLVFTHGHEDHIGALPHCLDTVPFSKICASAFTLELLNNKLRELSKPDLRDCHILTGHRPSVRVAGRQLRFFRTNHSIPQSYGFSFDTPWGACVFTSDFKSIPESGKLPGNIFMLFSDSTNAVTEEPVNEREMNRSLADAFKNCDGALVTTTFSTNIRRIAKFIELGQKQGRKIFLAGRNLVNAVEAARNTGLLKPFMTGNWEKIGKLRRSEILVITTGTQGEKFSALFLIAQDNYKGFALEKGDRIVISSSIIPGNERNIFSMVNRLYEHDVDVRYALNSTVHTSGHAGRSELRELIATLRPRYFVPVHGEYRQLVAHGKLAVEAGVIPDNVLVARNGCEIEVRNGAACVAARHKTGRILIDAGSGEQLGRDTMKQRYRLSEEGVLIVRLRVRPGLAVELESIGFSGDALRMETLAAAIRENLMKLPAESLSGEQSRANIAAVVKPQVRKLFGKKPFIIPVMEETACF